MHNLKTDLEGALRWLYNCHKEVEERFLQALKRVPSFGDDIVDGQLGEYVEHIANWPRCNDCWNFESGRYFGDKGLEIQQTRYVRLLPKCSANPGLKRDQVVIPLVEL